MNETRVVCILSMHRSGSSMVANILARNNIPVGNYLVGSNAFNEEGHFEDRIIVHINKKILLHLNASWSDPKFLPENWTEDDYLQRLRIKALKYFKNSISKNTIFAFKDPRTCITLPFWETIFNNMIYVVVLRNAEDVVRSITKRNQTWLSKKYFVWRALRFVYHQYRYRGAYEKISVIDEEKALKLWEIYNLQISEYTKNRNRIVVQYESVLNNPKKEIKKIMSFVCPEIDIINTDAVKHHLNHGTGRKKSDERISSS